jgi:hypothetical protein
MTHDEQPNDSMLAAELRGSLAGLTVAARPPATAIASRGQARRRRVAGLTGLGLSGAVTIQADAFTLTSNANGTDTLTISDRTRWNPARLRQALAAHHIPALVETGAVNCQSAPVPNHHAMTTTTSHGQTVLIINPTAIPVGAELYFEQLKLRFVEVGSSGLIWTHAHTCR